MIYAEIHFDINDSGYGVKKGVANEVFFDQVKTTAVKLGIELPDDNATGVFEWEIK